MSIPRKERKKTKTNFVFDDLPVWKLTNLATADPSFDGKEHVRK